MSKDMLGPVTRALVSVPQNRLGLFTDLANKMADEESGDQWHTLISQTIRQGLPKNDRAVAPPQSPQYLRSLSAGQIITIGPCDGTETLAQAADLFTGYLDPDFANYGTDMPSAPTPETPVEVYELVKNGRFDQSFPSISTNLDRLCLSQHQIKKFVREQAQWLHPKGWSTLLPFKVKFDEGTPQEREEVFVANVYRYSDRLLAGVCRFSDDYVWDAGYRFRVVLPQLALKP